MDKKVIDNIVWYIPFRKLRDAVREYLSNISNYVDSNKDFKIIHLITKEATKESVRYIC